MKTTNYRNGNCRCRTYLKQYGYGWEVGFLYGTTPIFVGNFIHRWEATCWYTMMNRELRTFTRKYKVARTCPQKWYTHFLRSHLYKKYYDFLDKAFRQYTRAYDRAVAKDLKTYRKLSRCWYPTEKTLFLKAA
ncbi:MAG: hypothetical protein HY537_02740 [Deltaproteobacteria bacterium]|nr:hypothetical protein [Deltaproteobacteria bacterium]